MPGWLWVVLGVVLVFGILLSIWFLFAAKFFFETRAAIMERGEITTAWVVHVKPAEGLLGPVILILICRDPEVPDNVMRDLVRRVRAARRKTPKDRDGAEVARLTRRQTDFPGQRCRLPKRFTGGWEVYSFFHDVFNDEEATLAKIGPKPESFPIKLLWDEFEAMMVIPPMRKKKHKI